MSNSRDKVLARKAKKLGLTTEIVRNVILYNHELNHFLSKKKMKIVNVNLDLELTKFIKQVAKTLKVDEDAVIGSALIDFLESQK